MQEHIETMTYEDSNGFDDLSPNFGYAGADLASHSPSISPTSKKSMRDIALFIGTFVSAFLLLFGVITIALMVTPVIASYFAQTNSTYAPQLPLSEPQDEDAYDITKIESKQLYPALTTVENVEEGNWIRIPSIDVNVPLANSPSLQDEDVVTTLEKGAALYPNGILPGRLGNTFIAAHSTGEPWKGAYRFAFLRVNELEPGNVIHLDYNGTRYTYVVAEKEIVVPTPDFRVISDRPVPTMSLMACWPLWSTEKRMLVHAELQNVTQLTQKPQGI